MRAILIAFLSSFLVVAATPAGALVNVPDVPAGVSGGAAEDVHPPP